MTKKYANDHEYFYEGLKAVVIDEIYSLKPERKEEQVRFLGSFSMTKECMEDKEKYHRRKLEFLYTALHTPKDCKDTLVITLGEEKVYEVQGSQLVHDPFSLSDVMQKNMFRTAFKQVDSKQLVENLSRFFQSKGGLGGVIYYGDERYFFRHKEGQLTVSAGDGRGEILNQNGFTKNTTYNDLGIMLHLGQHANTQDNDNPTQKLSPKP
jgi:hypothetical protein